jgi:FAD:protein FMN transferase
MRGGNPLRLFLHLHLFPTAAWVMMRMMMKMKMKMMKISAAGLAGFWMLCVSRGAEEALQRFSYEKAEMGLPFRITLYAVDEATAKAAVDAAYARIAEMNAVFSDYDPDSEVSRLSRTHNEWVPVSTELWRVLEHGQKLAEKTDGAFDVTIGPLVNTWRRARRKNELPSPELLAEMKARVGWRKLQLDPERKAAKLLAPDMRIDLGGIAKGYAIDAALAVVMKRGLTRALVAGSGDMAAGDPPPGQPGWKIEVAELDVPGGPRAQVVLLKHSAIATSGDSFQHVEIGGIRYSHIVDPRTGIGLTDHSLVTILADSCSIADSLDTTISVLGPERGMQLIEESPGVAARFVRKPGETIEVRYSSRWPKP